MTRWVANPTIGLQPGCAVFGTLALFFVFVRFFSKLLLLCHACWGIEHRAGALYSHQHTS